MDSVSAPGPASFLGGIIDSRVRRPDRSSAFVVSAGVAVLYAALGLLTLHLGQMTGLASPAWPAAGVAFAAALWWRWRALPGVFIGSVGVNVYWLTRLGEAGWQTWFAAAAIGLGAVLGAAAGAGLVHRFVGPARRLDTPRAVMLTLALGGLVASTIAPTIGVAAQLTTDLLSTSEAAFGWLTWWVGDAIGVIVFAPLVLMFLPSQAEYWSGRRWKIAVPSLLIFGILMAAIMQNVALERTRINSAMDQLGDQAATDLAGNIALHQEVLEGLRGLVDASVDATAEEFDAYTNNVLPRFPNLAALSWNPVVTEADLAAFQERQREQSGLEDFTVTERDADGNLRPVSPRPEYVVVAYIEPIADNRSARGFDIYSNPARAAAIETARDTGRPTATGPIDLVQESGTQKGMLALLPVYEGGSDPGSEPARRAALRGFAVGVYRLSDLLTETFRGTAWDSVGVTLVDVSDRADPVAIADIPARDSAAPDQVTAAPTATTLPLDVYGRTWELTVRPTGAAFTDRHSGVMAILLLAALAVTLLLEAFLLILSGMESLARRLMSELGGAARYVTSILPGDLDAPVPVTSRYIPSDELGGDSFDHRWIDDDHLIVYLIDVSGHGIGPAMFSVSVHNLLRSGTLDHDTLADPGRVLTELNRLFQMDRQAGNYFTIWYGVYQPSTRTLRYARAGHPPAVVMTADGSDPVLLASGSVPIGVLADTTYETHDHHLPPNADLLLYSDGAFELALPGGGHWALEDFIDLCARTARSPDWTLEDLVGQLRNRSETGHFDDDCTLVRVALH
jgi:CHASE1-domain containing sensor protein